MPMGVPTSGFARGRAVGLRRLSLLFSLTAFLLLQGCGSLPMRTDEPSFQRRYGDFKYCTVEVVRQSGHHTCGPACLSSVLTYWGVEISEAEIVEKYHVAAGRPYFLLALRDIALAEGLKAYVVSMDEEPHDAVAEQISKGRPLICAVRLPGWLHSLDGIPILGTCCRSLAWALDRRKDHFVVVIGVKPERVLVMDPVWGFTTLSWPRFEEAWSQMKHACLLVSK